MESTHAGFATRQRSGKLRGHYQTVEYLQRLGPTYLDLIFEFSKWCVDRVMHISAASNRLSLFGCAYRVLASDVEDGFSIFASDDMPEIATLPHAKVLAHLKANCGATSPGLIIRYLVCSFAGLVDSDFGVCEVFSYNFIFGAAGACYFQVAFAGP